jgi:hypothetical protein
MTTTRHPVSVAAVVVTIEALALGVATLVVVVADGLFPSIRVFNALCFCMCLFLDFELARDYGLVWLCLWAFSLSTVGDPSMSLWYPESSPASWRNHGRRFGLICVQIVDWINT